MGKRFLGREVVTVLRLPLQRRWDGQGISSGGEGYSGEGRGGLGWLQREGGE